MDYLNLEVIEIFCEKIREGFGLVAFLVVRAVSMVMKVRGDM